MKTVYVVEDPSHYFHDHYFESKERAEEYEAALQRIDDSRNDSGKTDEDISSMVFWLTAWLREHGSNE